MSTVSRVSVVLLLSIHAVLTTAQAGGSGKVRRLDFEETPAAWVAFVPRESETAGCSVSRDVSIAHGGVASVQLRCDRPARFAIRPRGAAYPVRAGERCRLSVWVRLDASFHAVAGTPGITGRFTLLDGEGNDHPAGHRFCRVSEGVSDAAESLVAAPLPVDTWFMIVGEITVPEKCVSVVPMVFVWKGSGTAWIDDLCFELISSE